MAMPQAAPPTVGTTDTGDTEYAEPAKELDGSEHEASRVLIRRVDNGGFTVLTDTDPTPTPCRTFAELAAVVEKEFDADAGAPAGADPVLTRFRWYRERHGTRCWELDALSPVVLRDHVEQAIVDRFDREAWHRADVTERAECESLATILQAWPGVARAASISEPASE